MWHGAQSGARDASPECRALRVLIHALPQSQMESCLCDFSSFGSLAQLCVSWQSHPLASRKGKRMKGLLVVYFLKMYRWKLGLKMKGGYN